MRNQILVLSILSLFFYNNQVQAQYASTKIKTKHQRYTDSLKQVEYKYLFPFLGQGAYTKGFDIPYPAGAMANYMWIDQRLIIDNLQLGLKTDNLDIPLTPVDFIEFGENTNTSYTFNVRPDIWVLPFLNVYGIFGYGKSHTEVNLVAPIELKSVVDQGISTVGVGILGAAGIGPIWVSVDANWTWNKPDLLDEPVSVNVLGLRFGNTFVFKNKPESNIALWTGGMRIVMGAETRGEIKLIDALPTETWDRRDQIVEEYNIWYDELTPAKKALVDNTAIPEIIDRLEAADGDSIIRYGIDKRAKEEWNVLFGIQYQYNKHWMLRSEAGLIGDRKSFLLSLNYRFLL